MGLTAWAAGRRTAPAAVAAALGAAERRLRLYRDQTLALHLLAREFAGAANRLRLLTGLLFGRFFIVAAKLHFAETALALHLLLQLLEGLGNLVIPDQKLHSSILLNPFLTLGFSEGRPGLPSRAALAEQGSKVYLLWWGRPVTGRTCLHEGEYHDRQAPPQARQGQTQVTRRSTRAAGASAG